MAIVLPRSVFFHMPKTGGKWVVQALINAGLSLSIDGCRKGCSKRPLSGMYEYYRLCGTCKHSQPWSYPEDSDDRFMFAFVRHPYTYYRSLWLFKIAHGWQTANPFDRRFATASFSAFVERVTTEYPGWLNHEYRMYTERNGQPLQFIGRQESLVDHLVYALRMAGETFDEEALRSTPPENVARPVPDWMEEAQLTPYLEARIHSSEFDVFERYGYA